MTESHLYHVYAECEAQEDLVGCALRKVTPKNPDAKGDKCVCEPVWRTIAHPTRGEIRLLDGLAHDKTCFWHKEG